MTPRSRAAAKVENFDLKLSRVFDASRDLVWRAWTDPVRIAEWFTLPGFTMSFGEFDLRPGGKWMMAIRSPDGVNYELPRIFQEILAPKCLVFTDQCTVDGEFFFDAITTTVFEPLQLLTTMTLTEDGKSMRVTINWMPLEATEAECQTFDKNHESMQGGCTGTFNQLANYLASAKQ